MLHLKLIGIICLLIMSKVADVGMPETTTPLASVNVCNWDTPPPLEHADVLNGWSLSWFVFQKILRTKRESEIISSTWVA